MHRTLLRVFMAVCLAGPGYYLLAEDPAPQASREDAQQMRTEIEQLKKALAALEQRLAAQEQQKPAQPGTAAVPSNDLTVTVKDLNTRVMKTERDSALNRLRFTGEYRFEANSIFGNIPGHYDGMELQNLLVKTMFSMNVLGRPPASLNEITNTVATHYGDYQYFANNLSFNQLKQAVGQFPAAQQQQLFGMLQPSTFVKSYNANNDILYTNRVRINMDARISDNLSFTGRLGMYKVFGDSTGIQVFNGQPTSLNIDGTTVGVPNSDLLRVERAFFTWNKIADTPLYLSIGRRPSTEGAPVNYREDAPRGGTPGASLIDYQFDGVTIGYHAGDKTVLRLCYGVGYSGGFGNGDVLKQPSDRVKDVHLLGANVDIWSTEKTFMQFTFARAFRVTDGFNGLMVLPNNPVTGDPINAPVVLRFQPSANLGNINLAGLLVSRRVGAVDMFVSGNYSGLRPNGLTGPFGGLGSDPFDKPVDHNGYMIYVGGRYIFSNDGKTKAGFEFNHGSKYWFNFAQAEDDIVAPKTAVRGNAFEAYLTHRIQSHFILKLDFIKYDYQYSGSGWNVGAPHKLSSNPILGFPTYSDASKISLGLIARY